ncbi:MAG: hypothetical protein M1821_007183 [Bathelium mastoideum]|nr:MAG: hypothetical protein M1821_007183 [Bathelium mastoideum]
MSFLNQMLASISSGSPSVPNQTPSTRPAGSRPAAQSTTDQTPTSQFSRTNSVVQAGVKRKAENGNGSAQGQPKAARTDSNAPGDKNMIRPRPVIAAGLSSFGSSSSQGTAKPASPKPSTTTLTSSTTSTSAAPKKGYLATLERAKAAQAAKSSVGVIKHKPIERLAKKDRLALKAEAVSRKKPGPGPGQNGRSAPPSDRDARLSAKSSSNNEDGVGAKSKQGKPQDPGGYKGTMRPSNTTTTAYRGTMRPSASTPSLAKPRGPGLDRSRSSSLAARSKDKTRKGGYASYSDGDSVDEDENDFIDDDEDEDARDWGGGGDGYGSEASSDMEAGLDEMDTEEQASLRAARREDEVAAREEADARARKAARKKSATGAGRRM